MAAQVTGPFTIKVALRFSDQVELADVVATEPNDPCLDFSPNGQTVTFTEVCGPAAGGAVCEAEQLFPAPPGERWVQFESSPILPGADGSADLDMDLKFLWENACEELEGDALALWITDTRDDLYGVPVADLFHEAVFEQNVGGVLEYGNDAGGANVGILFSFTMPSVGNVLGFEVERYNDADGLGMFFLGNQSASMPLLGGTVLIEPSEVFFATGFPVIDGRAKFCLPIPDIPSLAGQTFYGQSALKDSGAWLFSNGVEIPILP